LQEFKERARWHWAGRLFERAFFNIATGKTVFISYPVAPKNQIE
jgi:hypothetical protein